MSEALPPEVLAAVQSEWAYQDMRWPTGNTHEIAAWLLYMQHQLDEAKKVAATASPETGALPFIRKLVTLGTRCMAQHGAPKRE